MHTGTWLCAGHKSQEYNVSMTCWDYRKTILLSLGFPPFTENPPRVLSPTCRTEFHRSIQTSRGLSPSVGGERFFIWFLRFISPYSSQESFYYPRSGNRCMFQLVSTKTFSSLLWGPNVLLEKMTIPKQHAHMHIHTERHIWGSEFCNEFWNNEKKKWVQHKDGRVEL